MPRGPNWPLTLRHANNFDFSPKKADCFWVFSGHGSPIPPSTALQRFLCTKDSIFSRYFGTIWLIRSDFTRNSWFRYWDMGAVRGPAQRRRIPWWWARGLSWRQWTRLGDPLTADLLPWMQLLKVAQPARSCDAMAQVRVIIIFMIITNSWILSLIGWLNWEFLTFFNLFVW